MPGHDSRQLRRAEVAVRKPVRELVVPHAVVAAQQLSGLLRKVRNDVPIRKRKHTRLRFGSELTINGRRQGGGGTGTRRQLSGF